jgi:hypothetical protein
MHLDPRLLEAPCRDAQLRRLFEYWRSKCAGRCFPARRDIDPLEIPDLLSNVFLVEVLPAAPWFRYRLTGTNIDAIHGQNITGKSPADIKTPEVARMVEQQYCDAIKARRPLCHEVVLLGPDNIYWHYERLVLPLSEKGTDITMFLCGAAET